MYKSFIIGCGRIAGYSDDGAMNDFTHGYAYWEDQKDELAAQIPMGRLGTVNEVAQAVLFLAGDSGAYITAQTLHVNGGMYTV